MELISVIVPIYNAELYLDRCIQSIVNQTYTNLEIVVINDGTKDDSIKIIKPFDNDKNETTVIYTDKTSDIFKLPVDTFIAAVNQAKNSDDIVDINSNRVHIN